MYRFDDHFVCDTSGKWIYRIDGNRINYANGKWAYVIDGHLSRRMLMAVIAIL